MRSSKNKIWLQIIIFGVCIAGALGFFIKTFKPETIYELSVSAPQTELYDVVSVVDGDTFKVNYNGEEKSVRLIGVNTPETVDPRTTVECFGKEASEYLNQLISGKKVRLESDDTQTNVDKYNRLLRYVYLDDLDVSMSIISNGYGYEYTYNVPYNKQTDYKNAQKEAERNKRGLWADGACSEEKSDTKTGTSSTSSSSSSSAVAAPSSNNTSSSTSSSSSSSTTTNCLIKGNINSKGEKIYHVPGQKYYNATKIDTRYGEKWFCSEEEARAAGWRKSKV